MKKDRGTGLLLPPPTASARRPLLRVRVADPAGGLRVLVAHQRRAGDELEVVVADGVGDRVRGGEDGDLQLLVPQLGLAGFDLAVQLADLVVQLEALLAELERHDREAHRGQKADQHLDHVGSSMIGSMYGAMPTRAAMMLARGRASFGSGGHAEEATRVDRTR